MHCAVLYHWILIILSKTLLFQTKVQFSLPDKAESQQSEVSDDKKQDQGEEDAGDEGSDEDVEEKERKKKKRKKSLIHRHPNRMAYHELKENKLLHGYFRKYVAQCESMEVCFLIWKHFSYL